MWFWNHETKWKKDIELLKFIFPEMWTDSSSFRVYQDSPLRVFAYNRLTSVRDWLCLYSKPLAPVIYNSQHAISIMHICYILIFREMWTDPPPFPPSPFLNSCLFLQLTSVRDWLRSHSEKTFNPRNFKLTACNMYHIFSVNVNWLPRSAFTKPRFMFNFILTSDVSAWLIMPTLTNF